MSQPLPLSLRRATRADAQRLAELGARTFSEAFAADNDPEDMAAYMASAFGIKQQAAELADASNTFFIAEFAGAAAGYAKLRAGSAAPACVKGQRPIELARLYAARAWLGRGVGEVLMRACVEAAQRAGQQTLWLGVWERNARARAFYRKWGFRDAGTQTFVLGSDAQTDIVLERDLI